jgi:enediyne biosynthesis protein E4
MSVLYHQHKIIQNRFFRIVQLNRYKMKRITFIICIVLITIKSDAQQFVKITQGPVVNSASDSRSANWVDINNDGLLDLMITNGLSTGQNNFMYINKGNDEFESIQSTDPIVNDNSPSDGATWADIDNDGDIDCFVATWYNKRNFLYLNNGNGSFTQVKTGSIATELTYSETAAWGDYDNDGKLDLYITNSEGTRKNILYKGNGDSTFTKINSIAPVNDAFKSRTVNWIDYDNDHDLDLFVTNEGGQKVNLYRNDSNGVFTKITNGLLANIAGEVMSSSWADVDNDGDFDVFISNYNAPNRILKNQGDGTFLIDTLYSNNTPFTFGSSFGDIDNDGDLDLYVSNAFSTGKLKNFLYLNNGDGIFSEIDTSVVTADSGWTYGCAFGDYNNDGFIDLATANCYDKVQFNSLYKNIPNGNNWFELECVGTLSNKSAIGAKIKLTATIFNKSVTQLREISSQTGHNGQNMLTAHFGLADASIIDSIEIEWPSGIKELYRNISINQKLKAFESISLGTVKTQKKRGLKLFPNPSKSILYLEQKGLENLNYHITDVLGNIVLTARYTEHGINISDLMQGSYFLQIDGVVYKFVKIN